MSAIRAFIAINLPLFLQKELGNIIEQLKGPDTEAVRWVPPENIHLTLKFLGDVSPANLEILKKILEAKASRYSPFEIRVGNLGAFPNQHRPRVIWVGIQAPTALSNLYQGIENEAQRLGYAPEDRPFSPHLTLGRVAHNAAPQEVHQIGDKLSTIQVGELGVVTIDCIHLIRSDLRPHGAIYTSLYSTALSQRVKI